MKLRNRYCGLAAVAMTIALATLSFGARSNDAQRIANELGGNCTAAATCGDLLFVSCRPELDGPTYYVRLSDEQVISTCGGACWDRENNSDCETRCPPSEWTCAE